MKKNITSVAVAVFMLAGSVLPAYADNVGVSVHASASASGRFGIMRVINQLRDDIRARVQDKRQENKDTEKENEKEKQQQAKEQSSGPQADRMKKWFAGSQRRLGSLIDRLNKLADRMQVRLDAAAKAGADVTEPHKAFVDAKAKITLASNALASASAQVDGIVANNAPKEAFAKLHSLQKDVIAKIRVAHRALIHAWTLTVKVKASVSPSVSPSATPTP